jgi:hypothetical protein
MYRTGLGDCFLLAFPKAPTGDDPRNAFYLLIDCGVFYGTKGGSARMKEIATDIKAATRRTADPNTGSQIDVLVVTHEHWDHVSGFHQQQAQDIFRSIDLGVLWMAWTEDLRIDLARNLHAGRKAALRALAAAAHHHFAGRAESETAGLVNKVLGFFAVGDGDEGIPAADVFAAKKSVMTEEAMLWLKDVYGKGKTEFLHPGGPSPRSLPGVNARVYVLGPPEDPVLIRQADPRGDEVYHKSMAAAVEAAYFAAFGVIPSGEGELPTGEDVKRARELSLPFETRYLVRTKPDAKKGPGFDTPYFDRGSKWRRIDTDWLEATGEFALQLDNATNNTSLAFALEIGPPGQGPVLLFPGDAQVGNWLSWFGKVKLDGKSYGKEMEWTVDRQTVTAEGLLRRTVLYKVGHHGSHNATLRELGLERMGGPDFVAMLPVDENVAQLKADYGQMPLQSLVKDLLIRTAGRVMRNDEDAPLDPAVQFPTLDGVPGAPTREEEFGTKGKNKLFIEYTVP